MSGGNLKAQGLLVILGATLIGVAGGVVIERARQSKTTQPEVAEGRRPPRDRFGPGHRGGLPRQFEELQLTQEQREDIDSIFQAWEPRTRAAMREFLPRIKAFRDSVRIEVNSVLTAEQRVRLDEILPPFPPNGVNPFRGRRGGGRPARSHPDSSRDLR